MGEMGDCTGDWGVGMGKGGSCGLSFVPPPTMIYSTACEVRAVEGEHIVEVSPSSSYPFSLFLGRRRRNRI